jgi:hypothetical protein
MSPVCRGSRGIRTRGRMSVGRSTSSPISSSTVAACASWPWSTTARTTAWRWCHLCRVLHRPFAGRVVLNETLFRSLPHPRGARRLARGLQSPAASIAARLAKPRHLRCAPPTAPLRGPPPHPPMKVKPAARLRSPLDKSSGQTQRSRVRPPGTTHMPGSLTTRDWTGSRDFASVHVALRARYDIGIPG